MDPRCHSETLSTHASHYEVFVLALDKVKTFYNV